MPGLTLVMRWIDGLDEYQFIQTGANDITVILKKGVGFRYTETEVIDYLSEKIDPGVKWKIQWGEPERTQNGKVLIVKNRWERQ